ncbi:MAG TPA: hypothetical protein VGC81_14430 [Candidatus Methylomirabilis sp.]
MKTRCLRVLAIGMLLVGLLAGCATQAANREDLSGMVRGENPEYLMHPLRLIGQGAHMAGNMVQYGMMEPGYFLFSAPLPEFVGLSLEERRYLAERQEAWGKHFTGEPQPIR